MTVDVLVVDDESHAREDLGDLLSTYPQIGAVDTASDATEALVRLKERRYDAVFLDIRMPGLDGIELAQVLGRFADPPAVVFVSAHNEHAVDAFELNAIDYLMKPVSQERLGTTIGRLGTRAGQGPQAEESEPPHDDELPFVGVELAGKTVLIERSEIRFAEAEGDYVRLHTRSNGYLIRRSLTSLADRWAPHGFVRIHRSYVVNLRHVVEISPFFNQTLTVRVDDADGSRLPVSRRRARELRDRLGMGGSG